MPPPAVAPEPPKKKRKFLRVALIVAAVIIGLGIIGAAIGGGDDEAATTSSASQTEPPSLADIAQETATPTPVVTESEPDPTPTPTPLTNAQKRAKYKASCKAISYKKLNRDADLLVGKKYRIVGQVMQIQDAGPGNYWPGFGDIEPRTQMLVSMTNEGYGFWTDNIAVVYDGRLAEVYEDDVIAVWGECLGQHSYESVAGYNITVPALRAEYVGTK